MTFKGTNMVNRQNREVARHLVEKFLAGEITNDDFANEYPCREKDDRVIVAIYDRLWGFWDDRHTHTLTGKYELNSEARAKPGGRDSWRAQPAGKGADGNNRR
jgi:hypothetical protein